MIRVRIIGLKSSAIASLAVLGIKTIRVFFHSFGIKPSLNDSPNKISKCGMTASNRLPVLRWDRFRTLQAICIAQMCQPAPIHDLRKDNTLPIGLSSETSSFSIRTEPGKWTQRYVF